MNPAHWSLLACSALAVGMIVVSNLAHAVARRRREREEGTADGGSVLIQSAVFAVLGLLLAFTFSQAHDRFQARRQLIVAEANAIGTLRLRFDVIPSPARESLRAQLGSYVHGRLDTWTAMRDRADPDPEIRRTNEIGEQLWREAVAATADPALPGARLLVLPALNEVIDLSTVRLEIARAHPPMLVFALLFLVALFCAGLAGAAAAQSARMPLILRACFALLCAGTIYLILDIEYPNFGVVNLDETHALLSEQLDALR